MAKTKHRRVAFVELPYRPRHMLLHPWELVGWLVAEARAFMHRGWYGWAHQDVWGFDNHLFTIISEALGDLNAHKPGCSWDYLDKYGERAWEQWHQDLAHTAAVLREVHDRQYDYCMTGEEQIALWERAKGAMHWIADNIYALWW